MKRILNYFFIFFILILLQVQSLAFAASSPTPTTGSFIPKTPTDKLNLRFRHQVAQIQKDTKLKKLTSDQSKTLKTQVEAIRKAELADLKQNPSSASGQAGKYLTDAQVAELNSQLDTLSKSIPIK